jgi:hypothetical protein
MISFHGAPGDPCAICETNRIRRLVDESSLIEFAVADTGIGMTRSGMLYVEDNNDDVWMLKIGLELLGEFEVLVAEDGENGCVALFATAASLGALGSASTARPQTGVRLRPLHLCP